MRQLADGWQLLRSTYGNRVVVHLATNARSSTNDRIEVPDDASAPKHFTAFLKEAWQPVRDTASGDRITVPAKWTQAWERLQVASGLDADAFLDFVRYCELEFRVEPETLLNAEVTRDAVELRANVDAIRYLLFDVAAREQAPVHLVRNDLLQRLGWTNRFMSINVHTFPIDDVLYQPIEASVIELEAALAATTRGYVGVIGSPGSGKSTLLTHRLRFRTDRVVRYYAFVPDALGPNIDRGEAENFLHDLVLALHREGFSAGEATIGFDRITLLERLHAQLSLLHESWMETGTKTLILVDGLDHVLREPRPERSFLDCLPLPGDVPEGVVFVLGSQTDAILIDSIRQEIKSPDRRVEMKPLSRTEIRNVLDKAVLPVELSAGQLDRVVELSAGHPLALVYLLNALLPVATSSEAQTILDETPPFTGDIAARYRAAWSLIADDTDAVNALGYIARLRGDVDLNWLERRIGMTAVRSIGHRFHHFFRQEPGQRWYIFHDSFRIFLLERTSETWEGQPDSVRDAELHRQIADWLAAEQGSVPLAWDELYHRIRAGQDDAVLQRATQTYFSDQVIALRPIPAIRADIALAIGTAARQHDPVAFARLVLAGTALRQREWHLEQVPLIQMLIDLGEPLVAVEHLRTGWRLRSTALSALKACPDLVSAGLPTEASRIFDLAEPLHLLGGEKSIDGEFRDDDWQILVTWAEVAPRYRDLEQLIEIAQRLSFTSRMSPDQSNEDAARQLRDEVIFHVGLGVLNDRRWHDVDIVAAALDPDNDRDPQWWFWLYAHAWIAAARAAEYLESQRFIDVVINRFTPTDFSSVERTEVAEAALRIVKDEALARQWLDGVGQPEFNPAFAGWDTGFDPFDLRYRLNRLLYAFGESHDPAELIRDSPDRQGKGVARFERLVCSVARIAGMAWRGDRIPPATIVAWIEPYLDLFDRRLTYHGVDTSWFLARQARAGLVERLIEAAAEHGSEAVEAVRAALEKAWNQAPWDNGDRRSAILAFARADASQSWSVSAMKALEANPLDGGLTIERIDECRHQAEAWLVLGETEVARTLITRLLIEANAISFRKDHQLAMWIREWLPQATAAEPGMAIDRVRWLIPATLVLVETTEEGAHESAATALIEAVFLWSPRRAVPLLAWCLKRGLVAFDRALADLLVAALDTHQAPVALVKSIVSDVLVMVPTDRPSPRLLKQLLAAEATTAGKQVAIDAARSLAQRAAIDALPSGRKEWRRCLTEALNALNLETINADLQVLGMEDREGDLAQSDLVNPRVSTDPDADLIEALRGLIDNDACNSLTEWTAEVESLATKFGSQGITGLIERLRGHRNGAKILIGMGKLLASSGNRSLAKESLVAALDSGHPVRWDRFWGEGTKLEACRTLVDVDRRWAEPIIYGHLIKDLSEESWQYGTIAHNLKEILPLLVERVPVCEIWAEIELFIHDLFAAHDLPEVDVLWLMDEPEHDEPGEGLGDLVLMMLRYPVQAISEGAQRVLARGILRGDRSMMRVADEALDANSELSVRVLEALDAVANEDPAKLGPLREKIVRFGASPDYSARSIANPICDRLGWEPLAPPGISRPAAYSMVLPQYLPQEVLSLSHVLETVAEVAGLSSASISWRAASLMREVAEPETWSDNAEERIGSEVHDARIYLPYRRPRAVVARSALFRVVAELVDSRSLDDQALSWLAPILRIHDPSMLLLEPARRPEIVEVMPRPGYGEEAEQEWLELVGEASEAQTAGLAFESNRVVAEETEFRGVDRRYPIELRQTILDGISDVETLNGDTRIWSVTGCPLSEYAQAGVRASPMPLVVQNVEGTAYDTRSPNWLGLNPAVGTDLGWSLEDGLLPRWVNAAGVPMVWSVWWSDGQPRTNGGAPPCTVGEGWLVVASEIAVSELRQYFGSLRYRIWISRSFAPVDGRPRRERECFRTITM